MLIIIRKTLCNLLPDTRETIRNMRLILYQLSGIDPRLMVHVKDNKHAAAVRIIYNLLNTIHEILIDNMIVKFACMVIPCYRNTNGLKARLGYRVNQFLGYSRVAPGRLLAVYVADRTAGSVKGIAEVPTQSHHSGNFHCGLSCQFTVFCLLPALGSRNSGKHHAHCKNKTEKRSGSSAPNTSFHFFPPYSS